MDRALPALLPRRRAIGLLRALLGLTALHRSRRRLAGLDARLLRDVGLSPSDAAREAERPAWDAPAHWLR